MPTTHKMTEMLHADAFKKNEQTENANGIVEFGFY
jgi:hypothetical protein